MLRKFKWARKKQMKMKDKGIYREAMCTVRRNAGGEEVGRWRLRNPDYLTLC